MLFWPNNTQVLKHAIRFHQTALNLSFPELAQDICQPRSASALERWLTDADSKMPAIQQAVLDFVQFHYPQGLEGIWVPSNATSAPSSSSSTASSSSSSIPSQDPSSYAYRKFKFTTFILEDEEADECDGDFVPKHAAAVSSDAQLDDSSDDSYEYNTSESSDDDAKRPPVSTHPIAHERDEESDEPDEEDEESGDEQLLQQSKPGPPPSSFSSSFSFSTATFESTEQAQLARTFEELSLRLTPASSLSSQGSLPTEPLRSVSLVPHHAADPLQHEAFRQRLGDLYSWHCVLSSVTFPPVLQAAQIDPLSAAYSLDTALLLRADLALLFASYHLSFRRVDATRQYFAEFSHQSARSYGDSSAERLNGKVVTLQHASPERIQAHYALFERRSQSEKW